MNCNVVIQVVVCVYLGGQMLIGFVLYVFYIEIYICMLVVDVEKNMKCEEIVKEICVVIVFLFIMDMCSCFIIEMCWCGIFLVMVYNSCCDSIGCFVWIGVVLCEKGGQIMFG